MSLCLTVAGPHGGSSRIYLEQLARVLMARSAMDREGVDYGDSVATEIPDTVPGDRGHDPGSLPASAQAAPASERAPGHARWLAYPDRQQYPTQELDP